MDTISRVARAASRDETRPHLTGVLVTASGDELRMVATDSYRLGVKETKLEQQLDGSLEANVPARTLQELAAHRHGGRGRHDRRRRAREPGDLHLGRRRGPVVTAGGGPLPELSAAAPRDLRARAPPEPGRAAGGGAPRRPSRAEERTAPASLRRGCPGRVRRRHPMWARPRESLPVPFTGEELEIGFNPEFFREGLESAESDELILKLISPLRPGLHPVRGRGRRLPATSSCRSA